MVQLRRGGAFRTAVLVLVAVVLAALASAPAEADHDHQGHHRSLSVLSYNLYLGSPLDAALQAQDPAEFVTAVAQIYGTALANDFPRRAEVIADTIADERPDLVGLQEVTDWVAQATVAGAAPASQDYLRILMRDLAERGLHYDVAAVSQNANIGPAPLVLPQLGCAALGDCSVSLKDRDVILVNDDSRGLHWWGARTGRYDAQETFSLPGTTQPVSFGRGWASVEARYRGERFRFLNTHLEVAGYPAVQEAQAKELLAGPARTRKAVIAVGDFNSAADGSTTGSYAILTGALKDVWPVVNPGDPGYTSGQNGTLSNPTSTLSERIDLVLTRSSCRTRIRPVDAHLVGDRTFRDSPPPLWPSDHAGLVATLKLR